jgi:uncharacterized protein (DUF427 family)
VQFAKRDIDWTVLRPSEKEHVDPRLGPVKYWDIAIEKQKPLKDAAMEYTNPPKGWEFLKNGILFRAKSRGDSGLGLKATSEKTGVTLDEAWFD